MLGLYFSIILSARINNYCYYFALRNASLALRWSVCAWLVVCLCVAHLMIHSMCIWCPRGPFSCYLRDRQTHTDNTLNINIFVYTSPAHRHHCYCLMCISFRFVAARASQLKHQYDDDVSALKTRTHTHTRGRHTYAAPCVDSGPIIFTFCLSRTKKKHCDEFQFPN